MAIKSSKNIKPFSLQLLNFHTDITDLSDLKKLNVPIHSALVNGTPKSGFTDRSVVFPYKAA